ncbi:MAG: hypothetical protein Q9223_001720 [Gallowayella weberi]
MVSQTASPNLTSHTNRLNKTATPPIFRAPNLTGCYAGTGGSTVITASPGQYLPEGYVPNGTASGYNATGGPITYPEPAATAVLSMDCTDFMSMPFYRAEDAIKFKRDPVCTSYLEWNEQHKDTPQGIGYSPPGVYDYLGVWFYECCGGCALFHPEISVHYFSTAPAPPRMLTPVASMGAPSPTPTITTTGKAAWITPTTSASPGAFGSAGTPISTFQSKATHSVARSVGEGSNSPSMASVDHPPSPTRANAISDRPQSLTQGLVHSSITITVRGSKYAIVSNPVYTIESQILSAGGPAVMIDGVPYSLDKSAAVLLSGTKTINLASPSSTSRLPKAYEGTFTVKDPDAVNIAQTLRPHGPPTLFNSGSGPLASGSSVVALAGVTLSAAQPQISHPILNIGGHAYTADPRPRIQIGSTAIFAGGPPVTIDGSRYSLAPSATELVVGIQTISIGANIIETNGPEETFDRGEERLNPQPNALADYALAIGSSTMVLDSPPGNSPLVMTINAIPYTANTESAFYIGTQILAPGSPAITVDSTRYSLLPLPSSATSLPSSAAVGGQAVITVASQLYTCHQNSPCTIASQVLTPSGSISVGADKVVYGEQGIDVVRQSKVVVTPSRGEVKTSHISGLTPIGEETGTAPAVGKEDADSGGGKDKALIGRKWMVMGVVAGMVVRWCYG